MYCDSQILCDLFHQNICMNKNVFSKKPPIPKWQMRRILYIIFSTLPLFWLFEMPISSKLFSHCNKISKYGELLWVRNKHYSL